MPLELPEGAGDVFARGCSYHLDNSRVLVYGLGRISSRTARLMCLRATCSYEEDVLNCSNGRLARPLIFKLPPLLDFEAINQCAEHFVRHLDGVYEAETGREISTYPLAFIVIDKSVLPEEAIVVAAYQNDETWHLGQQTLSVDVELAQSLDSLLMGDISARDLLGISNTFDINTPAEEGANSTQDKRVFAVFSTGLESALPLLALIDPDTDRVLPSEATADLLADPENSRFHMPRQRMLELFPIICRDDERRGWRTKGRRLHKHVFICCDNDDPEELGVLIIQMRWSGDVKQSDEILLKAGSEATLQETRVGVKQALARARGIADELA